jgi:hypothetical protein
MLIDKRMYAEFRRIRALLNQSPTLEELEALAKIESKEMHAMAFLFINAVGLTIVGCLCLYFLFIAQMYPS